MKKLLLCAILLSACSTGTTEVQPKIKAKGIYATACPRFVHAPEYSEEGSEPVAEFNRDMTRLTIGSGKNRERYNVENMSCLLNDPGKTGLESASFTLAVKGRFNPATRYGISMFYLSRSHTSGTKIWSSGRFPYKGSQVWLTFRTPELETRRTTPVRSNP
jgi:hypothetical protein